MFCCKKKKKTFFRRFFPKRPQEARLQLPAPPCAPSPLHLRKRKQPLKSLPVHHDFFGARSEALGSSMMSPSHRGALGPNACLPPSPRGATSPISTAMGSTSGSSPGRKTLGPGSMSAPRFLRPGGTCGPQGPGESGSNGEDGDRTSLTVPALPRLRGLGRSSLSSGGSPTPWRWILTVTAFWSWPLFKETVVST